MCDKLVKCVINENIRDYGYVRDARISVNAEYFLDIFFKMSRYDMYVHCLRISKNYIR